MTKQGNVRLCAYVALAYAALYYLLRSTPSFINLSAGLSLTAFLFSSRRLWPAYVAGQLLGASVAALGQYGQAPYTTTWMATVVVLPMVVSLWIAVVARRSEDHVGFFGLGDASRFLVIAGLGSVALGVSGLVILSTLASDVEALYPGWVRRLWLYSIGSFVGAIAVAPAVASIRDRFLATRSISGLLKGFESTLRRHFLGALHVLAWCVPAVALSTIITSPEALWIIRLAMALALCATTVTRSRPQPIAFALPCVMISLALTQGEQFRAPQLLQVTDLTAFIGALVLVVSMRSAEERAVARNASANARHWKRSAQERAQLPSIIRRQQAAQIDRVLNCISQTDAALRNEDRDREEVAMTWWRTISTARHQLRSLRDSVAPPVLIGHGLAAALAASPVVVSVEDGGGTYHSHTPAAARELSQTIQETAYHVATKAAFLLMSHGRPSRVAVRVRVGMKAGRRWAVVTVKADSVAELTEANDSHIRYTESSIKDLAKIARAFGGALHRRDLGTRQIISALFVDDAVETVFGLPMKRAGER
jgi:hypothetical protein